MSKRIICGGDLYCRVTVSDNFDKAMAELNALGWRKEGVGLSWDYYCPRHQKYSKPNPESK